MKLYLPPNQCNVADIGGRAALNLFISSSHYIFGVNIFGYWFVLGKDSRNVPINYNEFRLMEPKANQ